MAKKIEHINDYWQEVYLSVLSKDGKGTRYHLKEGKNVIGRTGDVRIDVDGISRQHACIIVAEEITIEDMGSASGTVINTRLLVGGDYIFDGDEIGLGPVSLRFTAKRRENRVSLMGAVVALLAGLILFGAGLLLQEYLSSYWSARARQAQVESEETASLASPIWQEWDNLILPTRAELESEGIAISAESAATEYSIGSKLFTDRMLAPGNAYLSIIHFKRALGITGLLAYGSRPAVANGSLKQLVEAQQMIKSTCDSRIFTYVRSHQMRYWRGCHNALKDIIAYSPQPHDPYNRWARENLVRLDIILNM